MAKAQKARLDADRRAKPRTRLVGRAAPGERVGPGTVGADAIEDVETGERTPLRPLPVGEMTVKRLWVHASSSKGLDVKVFASLKSGNEVRDYFSNCAPKVVPSDAWPGEFSSMLVQHGDENGWRETFVWGEEDALIEADDLTFGKGLLVAFDGKTVVDAFDPEWEPPEED